MANKEKVEQRVKNKLTGNQLFRLPEAEHYLRTKNNFTTQVQLRNWYQKDLIPGHQPLKGSPLLLTKQTLDAIVAGKLPA